MLNVRFRVNGALKVIKRVSQTVSERKNNVILKSNEKIKGTMVENWAKYWKSVYKDYADVANDIKQDMKEKPTKAVLILSGLGFITYCAKHNPNADHFKGAYIKAYNDIVLVHQDLQRTESTKHLLSIGKAYNSNLIRRSNFGVFSLIWIDDYSPSCNTYESQCSYLQIPYLKWLDRVIDVGFLDTWWVLVKKMTDYDVNY